MQKLNALTSLRFVAASMIVFHHLDGHFGMSKVEDRTFPLAQAVSFFFILSGFILAYAYSHLETWESKKKFFVARIARVWPLHFAFFCLICLLSLFGLMKTGGEIQEAIFNILMVHAWIPSASSYFSFNSPSWSISTEFFFYLCFPFIIHQWSKTWAWKALVIFSLPMSLIFLTTYFELPNYSSHDLYAVITKIGLLNIHPLARLPEFFLGIFAAHFWIKYQKHMISHYAWCSIMEMVTLLFVFFNLFYYQKLTNLILQAVPRTIFHGFYIWLQTGILTSLSFILLIMCFAFEKGIISKFLSKGWCVLLGEMSFSIYLFHQIAFRGFVSRSYLLAQIPDSLKLLIFWAIVIPFSYFTLRWIEYPARNWILRKYNERQIAKQTQLMMSE